MIRRAMKQLILTACVGERRWELGSQYVVQSLHETIQWRLARELPGDRYPLLSTPISRLERDELPQADAELRAIASELGDFKPKDALWLGWDVGMAEPPAPAAGVRARTLADVFRAPDGRRVVDVLLEAIAYARERRGRRLEVR